MYDRIVGPYILRSVHPGETEEVYGVSALTISPVPPESRNMFESGLPVLPGESPKGLGLRRVDNDPSVSGIYAAVSVASLAFGGTISLELGTSITSPAGKVLAVLGDVALNTYIWGQYLYDKRRAPEKRRYQETYEAICSDPETWIIPQADIPLMKPKASSAAPDSSPAAVSTLLSKPRAQENQTTINPLKLLNYMAQVIECETPESEWADAAACLIGATSDSLRRISDAFESKASLECASPAMRQGYIGLMTIHFAYTRAYSSSEDGSTIAPQAFIPRSLREDEKTTVRFPPEWQSKERPKLKHILYKLGLVRSTESSADKKVIFPQYWSGVFIDGTSNVFGERHETEVRHMSNRRLELLLCLGMPHLRDHYKRVSNGEQRHKMGVVGTDLRA
jgi:hypothetical protein